MYKLLALLSVAVLLLAGSTSHAATPQELLRQIAQIQAQIAALQAQLGQAQAAQPFTSFQATLRMKDQNAEVKKLQEILKQEGLFCAACKATGYFGWWTKAALINFQRKYRLAVNGIVDEQTREKLNQIANPPQPPLMPPSLQTPLSWPLQQSPSRTPDTTPPVFTISINAGAASTNNPEVIIQVECKDPSGGEAIRFSNLSAFTQEPWEGAAMGKRWTLASGDGLKTVYAQCKDEKGNIATVSDTITLDATPPLRSNGTPTGTLPADTTIVTLSLTTDEPAVCRYSGAKGLAYESMRPEDAMSTGLALSHAIMIAPPSSGTQSYAIRCQDSSSNANPDDLLISFSIGATNPTLHNPSEGTSKNTSYTIPFVTIKYFPQETYSALWKKTIDITNELRTAIETASNNSLRYQLKDTKRFAKEFTGYQALFGDLDLCKYVAEQGVTEVWLFTALAGHWKIAEQSPELPICAKTYRVYNFDYTKGTLEAFETWSSLLEKELEMADKALFRELFQGPPYPQAQKVIGRCGSPLNPPNAAREGDRENKQGWYSDCLDWRPDSVGTISFLDCSLWNCAPLQYMIWNWRHMPGQNNTKTYQGKQLRNWWDVHGDFDNAISSSRRLTMEP